MKRVIVAVLLSSMVVAPAFADNSPYYAGVSLGSSSLPASSTSAFGIFAGYKLDKSMTPFMNNVGTLAIEGQYTSLGSDTASTSFAGNTLTATAQYSTIGVDAVAMIPIKSVNNLSAFGKLGFNDVSASTSCSGTGIYAGTACSYSASSGINLGYGLGVQYNVNREFDVRAGYQSYASSVSTIYAAGIYNF